MTSVLNGSGVLSNDTQVEVEIVPSTDLSQVAQEINQHHGDGKRHLYNAILSFKQAGEKLIQVKASLLHGEWGDWLAEHCPDISERTARNYMRLAENWQQIEQNGNGVADLSLRKALDLLKAAKALSDGAEEERESPDLLEPPVEILSEPRRGYIPRLDCSWRGELLLTSSPATSAASRWQR
ncbi:MAG: DUF3102 domain-containing protein [Spirulinaceae cyanobacterium RM2_2_10]|nr:DUF3102 domain-containing protein [Spirulinaceae cyanobacterium RM2_2_10]